MFFEKGKVDSKFTSKRVWKLDLHPNRPWNLEHAKKIVGGEY
jgi:hypothetical protein